MSGEGFYRNLGSPSIKRTALSEVDAMGSHGLNGREPGYGAEGGPVVHFHPGAAN